MSRINVGLHAGAELTIVATERIATQASSWHGVETHVIHASRVTGGTDVLREHIVALQHEEDNPLASPDARFTLSINGVGADALWRTLRDDTRLVTPIRGVALGPLRLEGMIGRLVSAAADHRLYFSLGLDSTLVREVGRELAASRAVFTPRGQAQVANDIVNYNSLLIALALASTGSGATPRFRTPDHRLWDSYAAAYARLGSSLEASLVGATRR